ncbi:hypothetical protein [Paenibacillus sp. Marseille-P2973]|uniref:hypothetical protein n=1 Tax=Paenibacillus sp. Marseille-P2973 TaxID=1871032 RepID=UPI001B37811A|nr:hypothetical protein [Paenibacillus sp. Marseille-P2973]
MVRSGNSRYTYNITNASFEPDVGIVNPKIKNITVQTIDTQRVPIDIFDVKEVGFKKGWWEFWE